MRHDTACNYDMWSHVHFRMDTPIHTLSCYTFVQSFLACPRAPPALTLTRIVALAFTGHALPHVFANKPHDCSAHMFACNIPWALGVFFRCLYTLSTNSTPHFSSQRFYHFRLSSHHSIFLSLIIFFTFCSHSFVSLNFFLNTHFLNLIFLSFRLFSVYFFIISVLFFIFFVHFSIYSIYFPFCSYFLFFISISHTQTAHYAFPLLLLYLRFCAALALHR